MKPPETFEETVAWAKEIMTKAGNDAAKMMRTAPPTLREEKTLSGIRLVIVWPDGAESNECVIQRTDDQASLAG